MKYKTILESSSHYTPLVSIVITAYNYKDYILECINSCLRQTLRSEIVIVDDCSDDNTLTLVEQHVSCLAYKEFPISLYRSDENLGVGSAANFGIQKSRGVYVVRVDADDYIDEDLCFILSKFLNKNFQAEGVSCDYYHVSESGVHTYRKFAAKDPISCGIMYRKSFLNKYGMYKDGIKHKEEEELRNRLGERYKIEHLGIPLYYYRMHGLNKTKTEEYATYRY